MKSTKNTIALTIVCMALGFGLRSVWQDQSAIAAPAAEEGASGRYALSAYGSGHIENGCFILDTATGQMWHQRAAGNIKNIGTLPHDK